MRISGGIFDLDARKTEIKNLETQAGKPDFWDDHDNAQKILQKLSSLTAKVEMWDNLYEKGNDYDEFLKMILSEWSWELFEELGNNVSEFLLELEKAEIANLLSSPEDKQNAIISIQAGAGGTEACDWAAMLLRMYTYYAERNKLGIDFIEETVGDVAGVKSITFIVKGEFAYGNLKGERGVHRLVRISPFDANKRRHTSFAAVEVFPESDDQIEIEINENDLKIDTYKASSAGGQHVNKTDSAVRITHLPSGIVVQCQNERSQHKNKEVALKILKARLNEAERSKRESKKEEAMSDHKEIAFGSQIRNYVFHPYQLVKDMRTGIEKGNINAVMDGNIDDFIAAYLKWRLSQNNDVEESNGDR
ncbi:MAG: peptide chain release factor 2 [bacterium]